MKRALPVLVALMTFPVILSAQVIEGAGRYTYERHYTVGERMEYELRTRRKLEIGERVTRSAAVARSEHLVALKGEIPHEVVAWLTYRKLPDGAARDVSDLGPSTVSLHSGGQTEMAKPAGDPAMLGMVTDLVTFYVAVGPKSGITRLEQEGDRAMGEPVTGDWSDGETFPLGQDKLAVEIEMTGLSEKQVYFETRFRPPAETSLEAYRPWMKAPVCGDTPNNWQMVRRQPNGYLAAWGCEEFTVRSTVDRETGRILRATMSNDVARAVRFCADEELSACQPTPQMREHRDLELVLLHP